MPGVASARQCHGQLAVEESPLVRRNMAQRSARRLFRQAERLGEVPQRVGLHAQAAQGQAAADPVPRLPASSALVR